MGAEILKRLALVCMGFGLLVMCSETYTDNELFQMGTDARVKGDFDQAVERFEQLMSEYPESELTPRALFLCGYIYANEVEDQQKATSYYQRFIDKYPEHEMAVSAKWELENMGKKPEEILKNIQK